MDVKYQLWCCYAVMAASYDMWIMEGFFSSAYEALERLSILRLDIRQGVIIDVKVIVIREWIDGNA